MVDSGQIDGTDGHRVAQNVPAQDPRQAGPEGGHDGLCQVGHIAGLQQMRDGCHGLPPDRCGPAA